MTTKTQKKLASKILKTGLDHIKLDPSRLSEISEAITRADIRGLIIDKLIKKTPKKGVSKGRSRAVLRQKRKGLRKGRGSRKGKDTARLSGKARWILKIRTQRKFLKLLKNQNLISKKDFRDIYRKSKGGLFRSKKHLRMYLEENNIIKKK